MARHDNTGRNAGWWMVDVDAEYCCWMLNARYWLLDMHPMYREQARALREREDAGLDGKNSRTDRGRTEAAGEGWAGLERMAAMLESMLERMPQKIPYKGRREGTEGTE